MPETTRELEARVAEKMRLDWNELRGRAYVRPMGRGIVVFRGRYGDFDDTEYLDDWLEDAADLSISGGGYVEIEVRARRIPEPEASDA